jgi:hypothetical protein
VAQKVSARRLQTLKQMQLALDLRATGASYEQIGKALDPPVSAPRAWKIVQKGLEFGREKLAESAKNLIQLSLNRLNRYRMKLEPNANDPAVVNTLVKIIECEAKLTGINAPVKVAETLPDGSPVPAPAEPNYDNLSLEELQALKALHLKLSGEQEGTPS